jgi:hypothetical protein
MTSRPAPGSYGALEKSDRGRRRNVVSLIRTVSVRPFLDGWKHLTTNIYLEFRGYLPPLPSLTGGNTSLQIYIWNSAICSHVQFTVI